MNSRLSTFTSSSLNSNDDPVLKNYRFQVNCDTARNRFPHGITIRHQSNGFDREIHTYVPDHAIGNPQTLVVFMTDGQSVDMFARNAIEFLEGFRLPPMAFFGLACSNDGFKRKNRTDEYLGSEGEDLFDHHYDAFINAMPRIAEQLLDIPLKPHATVVAGYSNGGAFAYRMAIKHPELFGNAIVMSPARVREAVDLSPLAGYPTRIFLAAGEERLERLFKKNAIGIKQDLDQAGIENSFWYEENAGHDIFFWDSAFTRGLNWLF